MIAILQSRLSGSSIPGGRTQNQVNETKLQNKDWELRSQHESCTDQSTCKASYMHPTGLTQFTGHWKKWKSLTGPPLGVKNPTLKYLQTTMAY